MHDAPSGSRDSRLRRPERWADAPGSVWACTEGDTSRVRAMHPPLRCGVDSTGNQALQVDEAEEVALSSGGLPKAATQFPWH